MRKEAHLACVVARDFRLGEEGEGLVDVSQKVDELDKKCERHFAAIMKEAKAAHRRLDHAFPALDTRMCAIDDKLAQVTRRLESLTEETSLNAAGLSKCEKSIAGIAIQSDQLTDAVEAFEESRKVTDKSLEGMQQDVKELYQEVVDLKKFNDKVVLFYHEDDSEGTG